MARARLGQHFLQDRHTLQRIATAAQISPEDCVVEIGAGDGRLTRFLLKHARCVIAVELDYRLVMGLREEFRDEPGIRIVAADFMKVDLSDLLADEGGKAIFVGNIPYYITTPIIEKLVESIDLVQSATLMMQQEVAERIAAKSGEPGCGSISAFVAYHFAISRVINVPRSAFRPAPKVDSSVLRMVPHPTPPVAADEPELLFMTIRTAFEQSRKTAVNSLVHAEWIGMEKDRLNRILDQAGVPLQARAEHITLDQFAAVSDGIRRAWNEEASSRNRDRHE